MRFVNTIKKLIKKPTTIIIFILLVCCCTSCVLLAQAKTKNQGLTLIVDAYKTTTKRLESEIEQLEINLSQSKADAEEYSQQAQDYQNEIDTLNEQIEELKAKEYTYQSNTKSNQRNTTNKTTNKTESKKENNKVVTTTTTNESSEQTDETPKQTDTSNNNENRVYLGKYTITHYCCEKYPHICGDGQGLTASGVPVQAGVSVAVDRSQIALGTELYIEGYGTRIAQDVGGAVKGNHIDVAVSTHEEAMRLGTVTRDVWMIV